MGIDTHTLKFLIFASRKNPLGRVATIGRAGLHVPKDKLRKIMKLDREVDYGGYCEDFLREQFDASAVESFDKSDYENATHIADMNLPLKVSSAYDTVIDGGCLEHIYNLPQALENISRLCADDGQIIHVLPANNLCGHGFWQFSPELFFSLYSKSNGYDETQVFLADVTNEQQWYEVHRPQKGERVEIVSSASVFAMVRTRRAGSFSHKNVTQSDYEYLWASHNDLDGPSPQPKPPFAGHIAKAAKSTFLLPLARSAERSWQRLFRPKKSLSVANPHLKKCEIELLC
jgi:SAM-dependent methyltransferase